MSREIKILVVGEWNSNLIVLADALKRVGFEPNLYQTVTLESMRVALELQPWDILLYGLGVKNLPVNEVELLISGTGCDTPLINILALDGKTRLNEREMIDKNQALKPDVVESIIRGIKNRAYNPNAAYRHFKSRQYLGQFGLAGEEHQKHGANEKVEKLGEWYLSALEKMGEGVTVIYGGELEFSNNKVLEIFNIDTETYAHHFGLDRIEQDDQRTLLKDISAGLLNGELPENIEFWLKGDRDTRHLIRNSYQVIGKEEKIRVLVVTVDITETRKTESALKDSEERYRKISELVSDYAYAFQVDPDGTFKPEWLTEAFSRLTGFSTPDEIDAFGGLLSMIHQEDQSLGEKYGESLMSGKAVVSEFRIVTKNGDIRWIRDYSQPVWDEQENRVIRLFGAAQDITGQVEAEEALKASEARNAAILKTFPDWIFRIIKDGSITEVIGGQELSSDFVNNISGKSLNDIFNTQVSALIYEKVKAALDNGETQKFEFSWPLPDGVRQYEANLLVSGKMEVLMFAHDISERARLEKMKSDFINRASHELRTPLTGALLMCDLIDDSHTGEERDEYWSHLRNELGRQRALVDRLLTVGRLETGSLKLNPEPLDIVPILKEAADTIFPLAKTNGIEILLELEDDLGFMVGDRGGLEQVFTNLINNAVKFSALGSTVRVMARLMNDGVLVSIEDHGLGIPAEDLPHLFEGFFRAQNAIEKGIPGSGVGLYIVRSIVQELGGSVTVESQLNSGTTFNIWLPAVKE